jgi:hypothetical protein
MMRVWKGPLKVYNHGSKTVALSHTMVVRFNRLINQQTSIDPYACPFEKKNSDRCPRLKPKNLPAIIFFFLPMV